MNFVFVNGRTTCRNAVCALCGGSIVNSYLRELATQLYYCDHGCCTDHCSKVMNFHVKTTSVALGPDRSKNNRKPSWRSQREVMA